MMKAPRRGLRLAKFQLLLLLLVYFLPPVDTSAPTPRDICNPIGRGIGFATLA